MLTGMTPILIKLEQETAQYKIKLNSGNSEIEWGCDVEIQNWPHPAEVGTIHEVEGNEEISIQVYTDGSKEEKGVGSGAVIFILSEMIAKLQFKLDIRSSNSQAEQFAILKALQKLEVLSRQSINPIWATIFNDSRITLDSLQNYKYHGYLVEEIRKKFASLEGSRLQIRFSWVKAHTGIHGKELADKVAKEAAQSTAIH